MTKGDEEVKILPLILIISVIIVSNIACYLQHVIYRLLKESGSSELPYTPFWLRFPSALGCYPPFIKFIFLKRYKLIGDPHLNRLCSVFSVIFCAMVVLVVACLISCFTK
jgi:hypothetical protein